MHTEFTVRKHGILFNGQWYIAPSLVPGDRVRIEPDPANVAQLFCYAPDGRFKGVAILPELMGLDPANAAKLAKRLFKEERPVGVEPPKEVATAPDAPVEHRRHLGRQAAGSYEFSEQVHMPGFVLEPGCSDNPPDVCRRQVTISVVVHVHPSLNSAAL